MERREIIVRGIVQGVGFRPFVHALAVRLALHGSVRNTRRAVIIEVEGDAAALNEFHAALLRNPPPLASIDGCESTRVPVRGELGFRIDVSDEGSSPLEQNVRIAPDVATCAACIRELEDPADRRYRYPFITCSTCGPRLTIVTGAPYDRERTTMSRFAMCEACQREYENPADRRFHAETIGCHACGPRLQLVDGAGAPLEGDPIVELVRLLSAGGIAAVKGIGGYHLACDATNADAVNRLRARKHRDEKPFAVLFGEVADIEAACDVSAAERRLLLSPARPIVLLARLPRPVAAPCPEVAPGCPTIGAMLPCTPVQHLLMRAIRRPLVMTSGNRSQEPIACEDVDALRRLNGIAEAFLSHDRPIHVRCDDGVSRVVDGKPLPIRRSRGDAPRPLRLAAACRVPVLAAGGHLKNTFALGRHVDAYVSHHVGDLDDQTALDAYQREIALFEALLDISPRVIAHDLHPDYHSTRYAAERATREGQQLVGVQHHHAHVASCVAEHRFAGPVIGVAFDGSGYGEDGSIWGGEFLVGDARRVRRMAYLRTVQLPGGEQAVREPWRMAMSHLMDAGEDAAIVTFRHRSRAAIVERMMARNLNCPLTSSVGRLFDAVAALAGIADTVTFEGQAAMQLEWLAAEGDVNEGYQFDVEASGGAFILDPRPMIRQAAVDVRREISAPTIARRFHAGLADGIAEVCRHLRSSTGIDTVVLTGGVFLNRILTEGCLKRLGRGGFQVYRHERVPPNDGGLSLGQLAVAAARLTTND